MATIDVETVGTTRKQMFKKIMQLSLVFLAVFSVSCLISFAGGRHRAAKLNPKTDASVTAETETPDETGETNENGETAAPQETALKPIYLTFDDGPYKYTEKLLDLLKQYDAKVTFFTTSAYPEYADLLTREAEEGHTVAVHTYSHKYKEIYKSSTAFWNDFNAQNKVVAEKTGKEATIFRFPGGSSNTVSAYNPGIMTTLAQQSKAKGLTYFDWNVASGDASNTSNMESVLKNCKSGVQNIENPVILCHDVKDYTVTAMESFIPWAIENGYTFLPLTADSPNAHHKINN